MVASRKKVKVRFAPSPTGPLHIGSARTALFNWIFAKANNGVFVLRIEDTDKERSRPEYEEDIKDGLSWLGLEWDEFYRQSDRADIHREYLEKLLEEKKAYYCFCKKEELEIERQAMLTQGLAPKYSGKCRSLKGGEVKERLEKEEGHAIRFKISSTRIQFKDLIRGNISFDTSTMGDMVIARDVGEPLYNFAVVVDDSLNEITHVIRGEDLISSTPRQILIMNALGFDVPEFAHLPIILNPDRSKMSKRFADTALSDYRKEGYIKEAMVNFLAFLGWHPKDETEIMSIGKLIKEFDIGRVQKGGAVFNIDKLNWLNSNYIAGMDVSLFMEEAQGYLPGEWKLTPEIAVSVQGRAGKLGEVKELVGFYFDLPDYDVKLLRWKSSTTQDAALNLKESLALIADIPEDKFTKEFLENEILGKISKDDRGDILWPMRVALSGQKASPSPFEIMAALGKKESERRINSAIDKTGILNI
jgi:glutamyl-tRNA synthetase